MAEDDVWELDPVEGDDSTRHVRPVEELLQVQQAVVGPAPPAAHALISMTYRKAKYQEHAPYSGVFIQDMALPCSHLLTHPFRTFKLEREKIGAIVQYRNWVQPKL